MTLHTWGTLVVTCAFIHPGTLISCVTCADVYAHWCAWGRCVAGCSHFGDTHGSMWHACVPGYT